MRKTKLTLLLFAALLIGICVGFYANSAIIRARIRAYNQIPANMPQHVTDRLTQRLDLTPSQREQVLATLLSYQDHMAATREKNRAMFAELLAEVTAQIDQHLTPEQQVEHANLQAEISARRRETRTIKRALATPHAEEKPHNNKASPSKNK